MGCNDCKGCAVKSCGSGVAKIVLDDKLVEGYVMGVGGSAAYVEDGSDFLIVVDSDHEEISRKPWSDFVKK